MNRLADYLYVLARYIDAIQADKVENPKTHRYPVIKGETHGRKSGNSAKRSCNPGSIKRMGIQGRITLDSAKRLIEKIEKEAERRGKKQ